MAQLVVRWRAKVLCSGRRCCASSLRATGAAPMASRHSRASTRLGLYRWSQAIERSGATHSILSASTASRDAVEGISAVRETNMRFLVAGSSPIDAGSIDMASGTRLVTRQRLAPCRAAQYGGRLLILLTSDAQKSAHCNNLSHVSRTPAHAHHQGPHLRKPLHGRRVYPVEPPGPNRHGARRPIPAVPRAQLLFAHHTLLAAAPALTHVHIPSSALPLCTD